VRTRTRGRELALKFLYAQEVSPENDAGEYDRMARDQEKKDAEARDFGRILVDGVSQHRDTLLTRIEAAADNWSWSRMATVDRSLLIIGTFELTMLDDIPPSVTINEIIELGRQYGDANSGKFLNGVLDRVRRDDTDGKEG
jgi:N utilization substance protein B